MKTNVGTLDRIARIILGLAVIGAGYYFKNWWGAVGVVPLLTGLFGYCPPYSLLGINTCGVKKN